MRLPVWSITILCLLAIGCFSGKNKDFILSLKHKEKADVTKPEPIQSTLVSSLSAPSIEKEENGKNHTFKEFKKIQEAIDKAVKEAYTKEQSREAIHSIHDELGSLSANNATYRKGQLALAKLYLRIGEEKEAAKIYQTALCHHWNNAFSSFQEALIDGKRMDEAAVHEYLRLTDVYPFGNYRVKESNFARFNKILALVKESHLPGNCEELVFNALKAKEDYSQSLNIAKAFCLAHDGKPDKAIEILDETDQKLKVSSDVEREEWYNIPLYKMLILAKSNEKEIDLTNLFTEYADRNHENIVAIYHGIFGMIESFININKDTPKITSLSKPLITSDIFLAGEKRHTLSDNEIAQIYDLHGQGLFAQGKDQEQGYYAGIVFNRYYPKTYAGVVCGVRYANYLCGQGECEKAMQILNRIVTENPFNQDYPYIAGYMGMANIKVMLGDNQEALRLVESACKRTSSYSEGNMQLWYQGCQEMKKSLEEKIRAAENKK